MALRLIKGTKIILKKAGLKEPVDDRDKRIVIQLKQLGLKPRQKDKVII